MLTPQAQSEQALFKLFADSVALSVVPNSIESRNPPEPDIRCRLYDIGPQCFELVEIIDADLAKAVGVQLKFQERLSEGAQARQVQGLADALVFADFSRSSTNAQKQQACDVLLDVLGQLPAGFAGNVDPTPHAGLVGVLSKIRITRGDFAGPSFQVGGATFISDPVIERIRQKFAKTYTTDAPIDLLAYYQMHPTYRAEYELPGLDEYVGNNIASSPFVRVWVFDADNGRLLYRS